MEDEALAPGAYAVTQTVICNDHSNADDLLGLRISSIFVILIGSTCGALLPIVATQFTRVPGQKKFLFFVKYFGSGVIVATAFIHLLAPATEALSSPCLNDTVTSYPWAQGISLMAVFALFFVELLATSFATLVTPKSARDELGASAKDHRVSLPGEDHLGHMRSHQSIDRVAAQESGDRTVAENLSPGNKEDLELAGRAEDKAMNDAEDYASQLISIFIFEFGVIFHSVIIGLTLAVTGEDFVTLYIVLVFHQTFEGLALGTRLAVVNFSKARRATPYIMAIAYGLSTPLAIGIGLATRSSYTADSSTALLVQGIFDATSSGILLYTGLIELMAHEFLFSETFRPVRKGNRRRLFAAYGYMVLGAGLMALLGYWA